MVKSIEDLNIGGRRTVAAISFIVAVLCTVGVFLLFFFYVLNVEETLASWGTALAPIVTSIVCLFTFCITYFVSYRIGDTIDDRLESQALDEMEKQIKSRRRA